MAAQAKPGVQERILLHLLDYSDFKDSIEVPFALSQMGIANAVAIARSNVPRAIAGLKDQNILVERQAHVKGVSRKRKAYFLTDSGVTLASETWERLSDWPVRIILDDQPAVSSTLGGAKSVVPFEMRPVDIIRYIDEHNCLDDLEPDCLGHTGLLYEVNLGEENYTFIDEVKNPKSCTLLLKGPNKHTIDQIKDAVRDGLRAVAGVLEDGKVVPGGGAFEVAAAAELVDTFTKTEAARGKKKFGIHAYADALLVVPKVLAENAGLDVQEAIVNVQDARIKTGGCLGLDLATGEATDTAALGVWDNYRVKKQYLHLSTVLATQLLLVDEVMKAGRTMGKGPAAAPDDEYA